MNDLRAVLSIRSNILYTRGFCCARTSIYCSYPSENRTRLRSASADKGWGGGECKLKQRFVLRSTIQVPFVWRQKSKL